jgi:hypothetical protein
MPAALLRLLLAASQQPAAAPRDVAPARPGAVTSGRVTERGSGRPLPRIVVTLSRTGPSPLVAVTDDDGRYEFTGVEPGEYALSAGPDRHHSTYLQQRYDGVSVADWAGSATELFRVQLALGRALTPPCCCCCCAWRRVRARV